jgi:hypothetical protein
MGNGEDNNCGALVNAIVTAIMTGKLTEAQVWNLTPTHWVLIASELADLVSKLESQANAKPPHSLIDQIRSAVTGEQKTKPVKPR